MDSISMRYQARQRLTRISGQLFLGLIWSYLMTFYGIQVCPYISDLEAMSAFIMFASGIFFLLLAQPRLERLLQLPGHSRFPRLVSHLACWIIVGSAISLFNYFLLGFPAGSGLKVIFGFIGLGFYSSLSHNLDHRYAQLQNQATGDDLSELQDSRFNSVTTQLMACFLAALTFVGLAIILLLHNDLTLHEQEYIGQPHKILFSLLLHTLFIIGITTLAAILLTRKIQRNMKLIVEHQLQQMDKVLHGHADAKIPVLSNDEFGQFAQRTNLLISDLHNKNRAIKELQTASHTDPLTGINNRRALYDYIYSRHEAGELSPSTLLILDLDNFKQINDNHGHDAGDRVLIAFARQVSQFLNPDSVFCRIGGEEFVVLLPDEDPDRGFAQASAICQLIAGQPVQAGNINIKVSCSIGLTEFKPQRDTFEEALKQADQALYQAKADGRNRVIAAASLPG
ncbi:GGDEF domain-containing protein [Amphritea sp. HPY]|uniref:GGDEF domain-containing protein n=1 Tax=Amphritea sp. HPY TaxID=3421652 RepID=UPI003D7D888C